jgi:hypothetical protein
LKVTASERGSRPDLMTKARIIAPQAAVYLAKLLEDEVFADEALIVIDWSGDIGWSGDGPMPEELKLPVMYVASRKWYPQFNQSLTVDYKLELEDFFGKDNATKDDLHEVVENMRNKTWDMEKQRAT